MNLLFFGLTLVLGWIAQAVFLYLVPAALPAPHGLLLVVLAFGSRGHPRFAMTLGILWGLGLDVFGTTAFGVQGFGLATVGFAAGALSRRLDADRVPAQAGLAVVSTLVYLAALVIVGHVFSPTVRAAHLTPGLLASEPLLNALVAPMVFWAAGFWRRLWFPAKAEAIRD